MLAKFVQYPPYYFTVHMFTYRLCKAPPHLPCWCCKHIDKLGWLIVNDEWLLGLSTCNRKYGFTGCCNTGPVLYCMALGGTAWQYGWWAGYPPYHTVKWQLYTGHMLPYDGMGNGHEVVPGVSPHILAPLTCLTCPPCHTRIDTFPLSEYNLVLLTDILAPKSFGSPPIISWCHQMHCHNSMRTCCLWLLTSWA